MIIQIGDKEFNFDGYANINEIAKAFDEAQNKAYKQGRADAIDVFAQLIKYGIRHNIFASINAMCEWIDYLASQEKEQINE